MFSKSVSLLSTSSSEPLVVPAPRPLAPVLSPLSVPWLVAVSRLAVLRMLPPSPPIALAERVVVAVVVCKKFVPSLPSRFLLCG